MLDTRFALLSMGCDLRRRGCYYECRSDDLLSRGYDLLGGGGICVVGAMICMGVYDLHGKGCDLYAGGCFFLAGGGISLHGSDLQGESFICMAWALIFLEGVRVGICLAGAYDLRHPQNAIHYLQICPRALKIDKPLQASMRHS